MRRVRCNSEPHKSRDEKNDNHKTLTDAPISQWLLDQLFAERNKNRLLTCQLFEAQAENITLKNQEKTGNDAFYWE